MRRRQVRRQTWWLLIALAITAALAVIILSARREVRRRRVEAVIARFQASPSQSAADELGLLLAAGIPTCRQGERILSLVLSPTVTTRHAYPAHKVPTINIESPFRLAPPRTNGRYFTQGKLKSRIQMEGQETTREPGGTYEGLAYGRRFVGCETPPLAVGTHRGQIRIDCTFTRYRLHAPVLMRLKSLLHGRWLVGGTFREAGSYKAHFEIPVEIAVAEAADAERVVLLSDPRLEEAVRQSFTCRHQQGYPFKGAARPVAYDGVTVLTWKDAPVALAFEPVLRLPDGREILHPLRDVISLGRFRTRPDGSGVLYCMRLMTQLAVTVPGEYEATIVVKPDPNFAYEDPAIKAIWGGTLEFPISFSVYEEPQSQ